MNLYLRQFTPTAMLALFSLQYRHLIDRHRVFKLKDQSQSYGQSRDKSSEISGHCLRYRAGKTDSANSSGFSPQRGGGPPNGLRLTSSNLSPEGNPTTFFMFVWLGFRALLLVVGLAYTNAAQAADSSTPEITAQGFDMAVPQEGLLGSFGRIRVRFEVPERIEELYVKERSYEADLAKTPEAAHFKLFGLETQVRHFADVTLNFQNYISQKIEEAGTYAFELRVTDRKGNSASATLVVRVVAPPQEDQLGEPAVETASFEFVRVGASAVSGTDIFGITWKTIKSNGVVIELIGQEKGASRFIEMTRSDYDEVATRKQLHQKIDSGPDTSTLRIKTAGGKATGTVFGVINQDRRYLLRVTGSDASLSGAGTTVTLAGEYKY